MKTKANFLLLPNPLCLTLLSGSGVGVILFIICLLNALHPVIYSTASLNLKDIAEDVISIISF